MCIRVGSNLGRDKTIKNKNKKIVVSSGKTNNDVRIFVQHCDKGQRTNAKTAASIALFLFETFCRHVNDLEKYRMEDCMHHVLGLGAMKLLFRTKAENLFIKSKRSSFI